MKFLSRLFNFLFRRNYDGARNDRLGGNWRPVGRQSAEEVDSPHRTVLLARARDLERNSDIAESAILGILRNSVGSSGIIPQAHVLRPNGEENEELNDRIEALWTEWAKKENCDASGQSTFSEIQSMVLRRRIVDGEIFIRKIITKDRKFPLKLQLLESDQLDIYKVGENIYDGIEVDEYLKPIAYWFFKESISSGIGQASIRVPASDVIHIFNKKRPSQIHGISELAIVMQRIKDTKEFIDAELVAARIAACFAIFIRRNNPGGNVGRFTVDKDNKPIQSIEPGMVSYLGVGEDVIDAKPDHPKTTAGEFISLQQRLAGAGLGQSYELLSRDLSKVSYSSVRQGNLEDRKTFKIFQQYLVDHLCLQVWEAFVESSVLSGALKISDFSANKQRYSMARWVTPGWEWVDPLKEVRAASESIEMGAGTLEEVCGQKGRDWQEVLKQRAREIEYAKALGLNLVTVTGMGGEEPEPAEQ